MDEQGQSSIILLCPWTIDDRWTGSRRCCALDGRARSLEQRAAVGILSLCQTAFNRPYTNPPEPILLLVAVERSCAASQHVTSGCRRSPPKAASERRHRLLLR
jgi:hypothetical protein